MQVIKANNAGACYGVRRALDLAVRAASPSKEVHTLGELIHNPGVVEQLERSGVHVARSVSDIESGCVVIRSHGVPPEIYEELSGKGLEIIDATCPHVSRAQKAAASLARSGCTVIVVGEAGHPEVEGIKAFALREGAQVWVVSSADELPAMLADPLGVVVQTTQKNEVLQSVVNELLARDLTPEVKNTICSATRLRQEEAQRLASKADVMLVIGGRNSSNTTRLAEICLAECARTYHIESANEITPDMIAGADVVGITAGASTPVEQINLVEQHIMSITRSISDTESNEGSYGS